jgi:hypothetical protein
MTTILQKRTEGGFITVKPENEVWFLKLFDMDFGYLVTLPVTSIR